MPPLDYEVIAVHGLGQSVRRAIAFLHCDADPALNAAAVFGTLELKHERQLRTRFDHWIDGGICDKYFHGWPNELAYKHCFVFKWKVGRQCQRFYGFLSHPTPELNPRFQLCVLCSHAAKNEWNTDLSELDGVNGYRMSPAVNFAITRTFPDVTTETRQ